VEGRRTVDGAAVSLIVGRAKTARPPPRSAAAWTPARLRGLALQAVVAALILAFFAYLAHNTATNLARLGVNTGFQFLDRPAGFAITQHLVAYSEASTYGRAFLVALLNTVLVSALGVVLATIIGFAVGLARLSGNWLVARLSAIYVETVRNVPLLLQIFFWYFAVLRPLPGPRQSLALGDSIFLNNRGLYLPAPIVGPDFSVVALALIAAVGAFIALAVWSRRLRHRTGTTPRAVVLAMACVIGAAALVMASAGSPVTWERPVLAGFNFRGGIAVIPEFVAMLLALSIYSAAFIAEIVRAGVLAVPKGQLDAARAQGLRQWQIDRFVVVPQALRVIIPPLTSQYLNLTKNSSLAAAIAYPDLMHVFAGTSLNQTGQAFEVMAITMAVYLGFSLVISALMNWYNRASALVER
jgi:general L-amino acid transport system permease protein